MVKISLQKHGKCNITSSVDAVAFFVSTLPTRFSGRSPSNARS